MNSVVWLLMAACIAGIHAAPSLLPLPVNPGGIGGLFRGPNQETIIRGPDGSEITSEHLGGAVQTEARLEPIVVPDQIAVSSVTVSPIEAISVSNNVGLPTATSVVTISENVAPPLHIPAAEAIVPQVQPVEVPVAAVQLGAGPALVTNSKEPHIIETELVDAPDIEPNQSSDLKGPSGSISVRGSTSIVSGPASTTISEPVRRIPIAAIPVAAPPIVAPSTVLVPPAPTAEDGFRTNIALPVQSTINLAPPTLPDHQITATHTVQQTSPYLNTELIPPPPPNAQIALSEVPGVSLNGATSIAPQTQTVSSTPIPPESLPQGAIDLGQTVISTTKTSSVSVSKGDIDVNRINLGQTNPQQTSSLAVEDARLISSSTISPLNGQNLVSSTPIPILSSSIPTPQISQQNLDISHQHSRPLFTTASDGSPLQVDIPSSLGLSTSGQIYSSNGLSGRLAPQDQSLVTNQIVSNIPRISPNENINWVSPSGAAPLQTANNAQPTSWVNVEEDHILPPKAATQLSSGQISTVLDTVIVQPTDPRNREVIEFNGKQLENVGNIVPVIHHSVLVAGGLTHLHQIPTSSISQLTSRNDLDTIDYRRQGRETKTTN